MGFCSLDTVHFFKAFYSGSPLTSLFWFAFSIYDHFSTIFSSPAYLDPHVSKGLSLVAFIVCISSVVTSFIWWSLLPDSSLLKNIAVNTFSSSGGRAGISHAVCPRPAHRRCFLFNPSVVSSGWCCYSSSRPHAHCMLSLSLNGYSFLKT